jgi:anti-anti-sigma factor
MGAPEQTVAPGRDQFMDMQVEDLADGVTNVAFRGRLDTVAAGAIDLKFSAVADSKRAIVVDLAGVNFLGSLGIRVLILGAKALNNKGGKLVLLCPDENTYSVLKTARIDEIIPIMFDRAAAIAAVRPAPTPAA